MDGEASRPASWGEITIRPTVPTGHIAARPTSPGGRTKVLPGDETIRPTSPGQLTDCPASPGDVTIRPQTGKEGTSGLSPPDDATSPDEMTIISTVVEALSNNVNPRPTSTHHEAVDDSPVVEAIDHQRRTMGEGRSDQRPPPLNNNQHLTVTQTLSHHQLPSPRLPPTRPSPTGKKSHFALITEDLDRQIALLGETVEVFRRERDELRRVVAAEKRQKKRESGEEEEEEVSDLMGLAFCGVVYVSRCVGCVVDWCVGVLKVGEDGCWIVGLGMGWVLFDAGWCVAHMGRLMGGLCRLMCGLGGLTKCLLWDASRLR